MGGWTALVALLIDRRRLVRGSRRRSARRAGLATLLTGLALLAAACAGDGADPAGQLRDGRAGIQLSGTVDGRQVAVRDGAPQLVVGDCQPRTGPAQDVCLITQTIGGDTFVLIFENPDLLEEGGELQVGDSPCRGASCDTVSDRAIVGVQVGEDRVRARGGEVRVDDVERFLRYRAEVRLELPSGRLSGHFDVVPRDD